MHPDLIVARVPVHEGQRFVSDCCVYKQLHIWNREIVFQTCFVEIMEINANPDLPVLLFDRYYISQPNLVLHFSDKLGCYQPIDLGFDFSRKVKMHTSRSLFHWSPIGFDG